jgi:hypothetical protein
MIGKFLDVHVPDIIFNISIKLCIKMYTYIYIYTHTNVHRNH